MLPDDVRPIILKAEKGRTAAEQKIADDYFPILRIDSDKIIEIMPEAAKKKYRDLVKKQLNQIGGGKKGSALPVFWTVEVDRLKEQEKTYVLTSGDPERPEKNNEVQPGWPFALSEDRVSRGPDRSILRLAHGAGQSSLRPCRGQSALAMALRRGPAKTPSDFGQSGRQRPPIPRCWIGWRRSSSSAISA